MQLGLHLWLWGLFRRSNQSVLKEINSEYLWERQMLKLKLQYFGHLMWRADSLGKTLMLGKIEGKREGDNREWDGWLASPTQWTWVWAISGSFWWTGKPSVLQSMGLQIVRHDWVTTTTTKGKDESDNLTLEVQGVHEVIMAESIPEARTLNSYWMVHFCPEWNYSSGR